MTTCNDSTAEYDATYSNGVPTSEALHDYNGILICALAVRSPAISFRSRCRNVVLYLCQCMDSYSVTHTLV